MGIISGSILKTLAKGALTSVMGPFIEEARNASYNAATDVVRGVFAGRLSIDEWVKIVEEGVDKTKEKIANESDLKYIGGKLKFKPSINTKESVNISFQLYFLDDAEQWQMAEADIDIGNHLFTQKSLDEIKSEDEIVFDVR